MPPPTVLFVPGYWVGPTAYEEVANQLRSKTTISSSPTTTTTNTSDGGFKVEIATLVSTGTTSPGNPGMRDDIAGVRRHLEKVLDRGEDVIVVAHSAGGFIAGAAVQGLTEAEKKMDGKVKADGKGVVRSAVLVTAAILPEGHMHQPLPFFEIEGGALRCKNPSKLLFEDIPSNAERDKWLATLQPQPSQGWDDVNPHAPWDHLPSVYVVCERDNIIPVAMQEQFAAGAKSRKIERLATGHMPTLVAPEKVAEIIRDAALSS